MSKAIKLTLIGVFLLFLVIFLYNLIIEGELDRQALFSVIGLGGVLLLDRHWGTKGGSPNEKREVQRRSNTESSEIEEDEEKTKRE